jgi:hypothetical protein
MPETKPKQSPLLRTPKPKKLGLAVPPALRLPHDELIIAEESMLSAAPKTLPSQTSHSSQTSLTRHTPETISSASVEVPVSPTRDYTKVANSIRREAVPAGLFKGKSKQLYDALYGLTRGAVVPKRKVRVSRPKLMKLANIGARATFDTNVDHLRAVGLITVTVVTGEHEGNEYEVFIPEEVSIPSQTSQTSQTRYAQKLDRLVRLETSQTRHTLSVENTGTYGEAKTSFKTNTERADDEAFAGLVSLLRQAAEEVTGKGTSAAERDRWSEVAELLVTELKVAAARTSVTSAPAFLTEHLRRRLRKADSRQIEREIEEAASGTKAQTPSRPELTHEQVQEQANLISSMLRDGAAIEELEEQFAANYRPSQWHMIRSVALAQAKVPGGPAKPTNPEG